MSAANDLMVSIRCFAYNHEPYIRQCLDGFVMQKTNFQFEAIVHDDASTDGTAKIIREYAEKYPDIIKPIYETENQYSKKDGSLGRIMDSACSGKYQAICEGDDYWTDPLKLQKQVDYLESHPDVAMCCSDAVISTPNGDLDWSISDTNRMLTTEEVIMGGGFYIQTPSFVYRHSLKNNYPECCAQCHVGDYPLQIFAAINGGIYYFADKMVVYRHGAAVDSYTVRLRNSSIDKLIAGWRTEVDMLKGLNEYSNLKFDMVFKKRIAYCVAIKFAWHSGSRKQIKKAFSDIIDDPAYFASLTWDLKKIIFKEFFRGLIRPYYRKIKTFFS